jgi:hypothetical protein
MACRVETLERLLTDGDKLSTDDVALLASVRRMYICMYCNNLTKTMYKKNKTTYM